MPLRTLPLLMLSLLAATPASAARGALIKTSCTASTPPFAGGCLTTSKANSIANNGGADLLDWDVCTTNSGATRSGCADLTVGLNGEVMRYRVTDTVCTATDRFGRPLPVCFGGYTTKTRTVMEDWLYTSPGEFHLQQDRTIQTPGYRGWITQLATRTEAFQTEVPGTGAHNLGFRVLTEDRYGAVIASDAETGLMIGFGDGGCEQGALNSYHKTYAAGLAMQMSCVQSQSWWTDNGINMNPEVLDACLEGGKYSAVIASQVSGTYLDNCEAGLNTLEHVIEAKSEQNWEDHVETEGPMECPGVVYVKQPTTAPAGQECEMSYTLWCGPDAESPCSCDVVGDVEIVCWSEVN